MPQALGSLDLEMTHCYFCPILWAKAGHMTQAKVKGWEVNFINDETMAGYEYRKV